MSGKSIDRRTLLKTLPVAAGGCAMLSACGIEPTGHVPDLGTHHDLEGTTSDLGNSSDMAGPPEIIATYGQYPALKTTGSGVIAFTAAGKPVAVIRTGTDTATAIDAICTHMHCTVAFNTKNMDLECPCHGSRYSLAGKVTMGPATIGLTVYPATVGATAITVLLG
jgi:Rieske Fe-S protein